ncbi:nitroreductase family protein [Sphingomonas sp. H160509]|uniref:nitroreductase family protein n=1 Tax=Sphingomonas sp. H160509 TaxID=2955313 RepID=UPI0031583A65
MLDRLLEIANASPSVGLSQPWRFVTVDDPARRAAVRADFEACNAAALTTEEGGEGR